MEIITVNIIFEDRVETYNNVKAYPVKEPKVNGVTLYACNFEYNKISYDTYKWKIIEETTGVCVAFGKTKKEALEDLQIVVETKLPEDWEQAIEDTIKIIEEADCVIHNL